MIGSLTIFIWLKHISHNMIGSLTIFIWLKHTVTQYDWLSYYLYLTETCHPIWLALLLSLSDWNIPSHNMIGSLTIFIWLKHTVTQYDWLLTIFIWLKHTITQYDRLSYYLYLTETYRHTIWLALLLSLSDWNIPSHNMIGSLTIFIWLKHTISQYDWLSYYIYLTETYRHTIWLALLLSLSDWNIPSHNMIGSLTIFIWLKHTVTQYDRLSYYLYLTETYRHTIWLALLLSLSYWDIPSHNMIGSLTIFIWLKHTVTQYDRLSYYLYLMRHTVTQYDWLSYYLYLLRHTVTQYDRLSYYLYLTETYHHTIW